MPEINQEINWGFLGEQGDSYISKRTSDELVSELRARGDRAAAAMWGNGVVSTDQQRFWVMSLGYLTFPQVEYLLETMDQEHIAGVHELPSSEFYAFFKATNDQLRTKLGGGVRKPSVSN